MEYSVLGYVIVLVANEAFVAGKTHTMQGTDDEPGIIPRVARYLFDRRLEYPKNTVSIHMSYMEIYKELVYDLLVPREGVSRGL